MTDQNAAARDAFCGHFFGWIAAASFALLLMTGHPVAAGAAAIAALFSLYFMISYLRHGHRLSRTHPHSGERPCER